ncbi:MAG: efflux RND transporter periplasmic adaptor subunit [Bacteroidales bacterium]|nr:efflux RND transporter periplasmic adaptor subunit [Bacteroidales bacterium]
MIRTIMKYSFPVLLAGTLLFSSCGSKEQQQAPPPEITVVKVIQKDVPVYNEFIGEIYGEKDIPIRARVEGFLEGIFFEEGTEVKKGQLLYTIDPRPFEADVNAQQSEVAEARTMLAKAESDLNRYKPLAELNAVSKSDLDAAQAQYDASLASVDAAKANLRSAEIRLGYTKIYSPIDGLIGITNARVGDFVGRDPNPVILNTVSETSNVKVRFYITESEYLRLARRFATDSNEKLDGKATKKREPNMELILSDGSVYDYKGLADFVDRSVDPSTGSLLIQANFPNPKLILRPGMYAKVKIIIEMRNDALVIPLRCIMEMQGQKSVYVVNDSNKVVAQRVITGPVKGDYVIIDNGLEEDDKVVIDALQKVRDGMIVVPKTIEFESKSNPEL